MADHSVVIQRVGPKFVGVCSCGRWRTPPRVTRDDAETLGLAHEARGDEHNRVIAAMAHGGGTPASELRWYEEQAENVLNTKEEREMWQRLADDLRRRVKPKGPTEADAPLF
jgi:hypothetical protein